MSAPKPGDRVRVTYEGVWTEAAGPGVVAGGGVGFVRPLTGWASEIVVSNNATVEVIASPVYVNSDTTEHRPGDVVLSDEGHVLAWRPDLDANRPWLDIYLPRYNRPSLTKNARDECTSRPLTLLVRDGQVVQP